MTFKWGARRTLSTPPPLDAKVVFTLQKPADQLIVLQPVTYLLPHPTTTSTATSTSISHPTLPRESIVNPVRQGAYTVYAYSLASYPQAPVTPL